MEEEIERTMTRGVHDASEMGDESETMHVSNNSMDLEGGLANNITLCINIPCA